VGAELSIRVLKGLDYNVFLARVLRRQNIDLVVRSVRRASLCIIAANLVLLIAICVHTFLSSRSTLGELEGRIASAAANLANSAHPVQSGDKNWGVLSQRSVFGALGRAAAPAKPTPPPTPLSLALIGSFLTRGQEPYAIVEDKKKQIQDVFTAEDSIFGQAVLKRIFDDRIEIEREGKIEVLRLDDFGNTQSPVGGITSSGDDFIVDEAELDKGLESLPLLLTQARAVPYFKEGRAIGLRLFAIKSGSLYEKLGLKNGDILKSINGNSLGDISQAMKLFEQLKQERSINLVLEREKQDRDFKYTIR
jgi:type II secretion system protein C